MSVLRAATRGSALALWQTRYVAFALGVDIEPVIVKTSGDETQAANTPIESMSGQGVFVREVQRALLDGRADFAVHSAKDLQTTTTEGLCLASIPLRGDPRDALVGCSLGELPVGGVVATGSVRRRAQLAALRPDLMFVNLRGNIDTRLSKAASVDAIVMAFTALQRLQRSDVRAHVLDVDVVVPQVAQGALAIECRVDDARTRELLNGVEHTATRMAVDAERAFLATIGGACDVPVGAHARVAGNRIDIEGLIASLDGHVVLRRCASGEDPALLGADLARHMLHQDGGRSLLEP